MGRPPNDHFNIKIVSLTGPNIIDFIPQIAHLRVEVFAEYPFLYIGDYDYEKNYLKKFLTVENAIVVAAFDQDVLVGLATGFPFVYDADNLKDVFVSAHRNPEDYFCFGEAVLRKSYRGLGIGKQFIEQREAHARQLNRYPFICFYTAIRPKNDPKRPTDWRPLAPFWKNQGFEEHPELTSTISWQEIGEQESTPKKVVFWIKAISIPFD